MVDGAKVSIQVAVYLSDSYLKLKAQVNSYLLLRVNLGMKLF